MRRVFATVAQPLQVSPTVNQEFQAEKRFHPSVIGAILIVFLVVVATFISYMESITYFDAFYACFITYSTIGFGDIDIYVSHNHIAKRIVKYKLCCLLYSESPIGLIGLTS